MNQPTLFNIYTARFPYLEMEKDKLRPVVVISKPYGKHNIVAILPLTSRSGCGSVDHPVINWREASLLRPSVIRIHRISTILTEKLTARVGALGEKDVAALKRLLKQYLEL